MILTYPQVTYRLVGLTEKVMVTLHQSEVSHRLSEEGLPQKE